MRREVKRYTSEFKNQAISLVIDANRPAIEVCRELAIKSSTLHIWLSKARDSWSLQSESGYSVAEIKRLKKELKQSQLECEILKKAAAYFAKETL